MKSSCAASAKFSYCSIAMIQLPLLTCKPEKFRSRGWRRLMLPPIARFGLEALRLNPEAFGSTFEAESARPLEHFAERLTSSTVFAAYRNSEWRGMAGFMRRQGLKDEHKGFLWGMYVRADARKAGVGQTTGGSCDRFCAEAGRTDPIDCS